MADLRLRGQETGKVGKFEGCSLRIEPFLSPDETTKVWGALEGPQIKNPDVNPYFTGIAPKPRDAPTHTEISYIYAPPLEQTMLSDITRRVIGHLVELGHTVEIEKPKP